MPDGREITDIPDDFSHKELMNLLVSKQVYTQDEMDTFIASEKKKKLDKLQKESRDNLAKEYGTGMSMLVGAGREFSKLGVGTADLVDTGLSYFGNKEAGKRRAKRKIEQAEEDRLYKSISDENPIATGVGQALPYLASVPLGGSVGAGAKGLATAVGREAAIGGALGAAQYDTSALEGAAWGAGGALGAKTVGKLLGGAPNELTGDAVKTVRWMRDKKLFTPPGMATGNRTLQQVDNSLATHEKTSDLFLERLNASRQKENLLVTAELGNKTDLITDKYLTDNLTEVTRKMNQLARGTETKLTDKTSLGMYKVLDDAKNISSEGKKHHGLHNIEKQIDRVIDDKGGVLTGKEYQSINSKLGRIANKNYGYGSGKDPEVYQSAMKLKTILNAAIGKDKSEWKDVNRKFALLKAMQKTKMQSTTQGSSGIEGYLDMLTLSKNFRSSPIINKLADVERLRKAQYKKGAFSASRILAGMLNPAEINRSIGTGALLTGRLLRKMGLMDTVATDMYLSGIPHVTGYIPKSNTTTANRLLSRPLLQNKDEEDED